MFFEIENTPEHVKKARRLENVQRNSPKEECPRLVLAPFSRPPQVVFENVLIGTTCERYLEVFNPSKQTQQITLARSLPPGLVIHLPEEWISLEPNTCYSVTMQWSPIQPIAIRDTIRFTNENRGRYDVIVILKAVMSLKGKSHKTKSFKISPGKIKKKSSKKSPVAIYKKKSDIIFNSMKTKPAVNVVEKTQPRILQPSNKDNILNDYSMDYHQIKCPFSSSIDSSIGIDLTFSASEFNMSDIFSNMKKTNTANVLQQTYEKSYTSSKNNLKPSDRAPISTLATDAFDNLTYTPLKSLPAKSDKLDKGPKIILSVNSDSDFDDSLDMKNANKENETHSILSITTSQPNKWLTINHHAQIDNADVETPIVQNKKIPNTSSPKELNSPNFSINTELSRISDLSFLPQRFSTDKKGFAKLNNDTHDIIDDMNTKLNSDTYTKLSPYPSIDTQFHGDSKPPHFFMREQPTRMCRQSLFREFQQQRENNDKHYLHPYENNVWHNDLRQDIKSPPRSITPPLQSIPEESTQFCETQVIDSSNRQMATFTIHDRTFEKDRNSTSVRQSWSKKAVVKTTPDLWKVPTFCPKKSLKPKVSIKSRDSFVSDKTFENNKSIDILSVTQIGNVYSQAATVDPFLSTTYFYDEEAVEKFEIEFKRWLNCILTPPADLDSNVEQKIDFGKAWIEIRNKEISAAPTKEQVSSMYHNSHRLESLRKAARALLMSPDNVQVFLKLNVQIERKLISIRSDRNLHLDVGLQKVILELLLSYNPLWLRIGLETIFGLILPLKSNNDIEGLTTFIIQRMFKNPNLKNKHSKSKAPNMLLPAYMEAIKKFTLKKFFMLVFFLDQAKQRKLISHDPCLFCRNAVCKESREIIIRFTRELIAGIGDITKHLRPLGYVVSHKQSFLDEYKYAVHNLATDIRDGVRLTKVMEIVLMKNGLMNQLRTPAVSRLQKIHNVQVALNALKEANFVIVGDITAADIADGHREKTLSLLWQIIHVFRAPLFEKAANVIQTWWRKKYEVIVEKRKEEERILLKRNKAASIIQFWWRRIQYNRLMEWKMQKIVKATITLQKFCRMWLCRRRLMRYKISVLKIEEWYRSIKLMIKAKQTLLSLQQKREQLRRKSAIVLQSYVRRWICIKEYRIKLKQIVLIQSLVRRFLIRNQYLRLRRTVTYLQQKYRSKLLMKAAVRKLEKQKRSAIIIQSFFRMFRQFKQYLNLKNSVRVIEERYVALIKMRHERKTYLKLKKAILLIQALYRGRKCRLNYITKKNKIIQLQKRIKAYLLMKKEKAKYMKMKQAAIVIQRHIKSYLTMKNQRNAYIRQRNSAILVQQYFRAYLAKRKQRKHYMEMRSAAIVIQTRYRSLIEMRKINSAYIKLKHATIVIQRQFRAQIIMRKTRSQYKKLRAACIILQRRYRAKKYMIEERNKFSNIRRSCIKIQSAYRAFVLGKQQRQEFLKQRRAALVIQNWFRNWRETKEVMQTYQRSKQATITIQQTYRAYITGKRQRQEYVKIRTATIRIQTYYRAYIVMKTIRQQYIQLKTSTITIQRFYRSHLETKKHRKLFLEVRSAAVYIQNYYRQYKESQRIRQKYCELRNAAIYMQTKYRSICAMRREREKFMKLKISTIVLQQKYRALIAMRIQRERYVKLCSAALILQTRFRAQSLMKQERTKYLKMLNSCIYIQKYYRAYILGSKQREIYLRLRKVVVMLQQKYRAILAMRKQRKIYLNILSSVITVQRKYRARCLMLKEKNKYITQVQACITIQKAYRAYSIGKRIRSEYLALRAAAVVIQGQFRMLCLMRKKHNQYQQLRQAAVFTQRRFRAIRAARTIRQNNAASKIQTWYKSILKRNECRQEYLKLRANVITIQSCFRMHIMRKKYKETIRAALTIQRYFRNYKLTEATRQKYLTIKESIIRIQAFVKGYLARMRYIRLRKAVLHIQTSYKLKKQRELNKARRELAAVCIQKYIRRYIARSRYLEYRNKVILIQKLWRGKLVTRLIRCEFRQKRRIVIKLQAVIRGYLVRKQVQYKKEQLQKVREENRRYWAASKIQALYRGHKVRTNITSDRRVADLRRRWREGALTSAQETLKERNEDAMQVLCNMSDIETVIRAFRSLELLTEVFPMMYHDNAASITQRVYIYMSLTNRSISSVEVLKSAASILVNFTRYRVTGPKIYARDRVPPILKFMWRFSNSETLLFCILSTYLWLFAKYDGVREDLTQLLHIPENHKMLVTIKDNVNRMKRMSNKIRNKCNTPQSSKSLNYSMCSNGGNSGVPLPALEPDYGITRLDKPRYFEDAQQAINCLFSTYNL